MKPALLLSMLSFGNDDSLFSSFVPTVPLQISGNRLAQIFDVSGQFVPTKASLYFKPVSLLSSTGFDLTEGSVVIDASNFNSISFNDDNRILFDDVFSSFTGNGFASLSLVGQTSTLPIINYPVSTTVPGKYNLYFRGKSPTAAFVFRIFIDGVEIDSLSTPTSDVDWSWFTSEFTLPDTDEHTLGIQLEENGSGLDKIYISSDVVVPADDGPDLTVSPYVTMHLQLYEVNSSFEPITLLSVYDFKTTRDEIKFDDWYNFDLNIIDPNQLVTFDASYAMVLSSSGEHQLNFVIWELIDNDEYMILPSAIKV